MHKDMIDRIKRQHAERENPSQEVKNAMANIAAHISEARVAAEELQFRLGEATRLAEKHDIAIVLDGCVPGFNDSEGPHIGYAPTHDGEGWTSSEGGCRVDAFSTHSVRC